MTAREQWSQGLQWGGCAWLAFITVREIAGELNQLLVREGVQWQFPHSLSGWGYGWGMTAAWILALALVVTGARGSRLAVATAIAAQTILGVRMGTGYGGQPDTVWFVLRFFLPMSVPLLPLVVLRVERPRVVLALAVLGRHREAWDRFGGVGVLAVSAFVVSLNRGVLDLLGYGFDRAAMLWVIRDRGLPWTGYMLPVVLFGVAALAVGSTSRRQRRAPT